MARPAAPAGVVVVDKPRGPTSHDVVARARRTLSTREVGHAGTLDPMATGVLVLATGEATKLVPYLTAHSKGYTARLVLGTTTETLDAEGITFARGPLPDALLLALRALSATGDASGFAEAVASELARTSQAPPAYSAIRVDGERAHALARRGEEVTLSPRPVSVQRIALVDAGLDPEPWLDVELDVAKGYYVRSFARDLAAALGTVGHLTSLRRVRSGPFVIAEATPLDTLSLGDLVPLADAARRALPHLVLDPDAARAAHAGKQVHAACIREGPSGPCAWLSEEGSLIAIGERDDAAEGLPGRVRRGFVPTPNKISK